MALVPKFNAAGIAPFSLGGQSRWTNMMWLEFLFDRIGGPEVFQAAFEGKKDAWSNPDAITALTKVQDLVKANGFIKGFSSITADSERLPGPALHRQGRHDAARRLDVRQHEERRRRLRQGGHLGWMNFPAGAGGKGDPTNTVGNLAENLSISSKATDAEKETANKFFTTGAARRHRGHKAWIDTGSIPIVKGADSHIGSSEDAEWLKFLLRGGERCQGLRAVAGPGPPPPSAAETLLDNIASCSS